jgi:hypothetical protein
LLTKSPGAQHDAFVRPIYGIQAGDGCTPLQAGQQYQKQTKSAASKLIKSQPVKADAENLPERERSAENDEVTMSILFFILLAVFAAYIFIAGRFYESYTKGSPSLTIIKNLLLSLAWPGNAVLYLLMRCVK